MTRPLQGSWGDDYSYMMPPAKLGTQLAMLVAIACGWGAVPVVDHDAFCGVILYHLCHWYKKFSL